MPYSARGMKYKLITIFLCFGTYLAAQEGKNTEKEDIKKRSELHTDDFLSFSERDKKKEEYHFGVEYRIETGYIQNHEYSLRKNYPDLYLHGGYVGAKMDLLLPHSFSVQLGLGYALAYGQNEQHFHSILSNMSQKDYITNRVWEHNLLIPVRVYYTQHLAKRWYMLFYGGPQLQVGMAQMNKPQSHLYSLSSEWAEANGVDISKVDLYQKKLHRCNIQMGVGGGFEWHILRLTAGYDFGLNNLVKQSKIGSRHMWEWSWHVSLGIKISRLKNYPKQEQSKK